MYNFKNDYSVIAHENILKAFIKYQNEANNGYGLDIHSENASRLIKKYINGIDVDIHFLIGGTSTNRIVISHILKPYQAVISATTGHIFVHETGTIENSGHKVIPITSYNGKIKPQDIIEVVKKHCDEHMVMPKMVYISEATETGSLYTKEEIKEISKVCHENNLYLFVDGARLAVVASKNVITIDDLAHLTDVFYIGGTKNGASLGEAVVITNPCLKEDFRFSIKQNGGMYAKGFVIGIQFEELFKDGLYFSLGRNSNERAEELYNGLVNLGIKFKYPCETNQIFPIVSNKLYQDLQNIVSFEMWEDLDNQKVIRFVTSFATTENEVKEFIETVKIIMNKEEK